MEKMGNERDNKNRDITNDQRMFRNNSEINQKFNLECNFLDVLQIRQCIPSRWREVIYDVIKYLIDTNVFYCINGKIQCISKTTCKDVYWNFVTKRRRVPKCCEKWAENYPNFKKVENIYPNIFKLSLTPLERLNCKIFNTELFIEL